MIATDIDGPSLRCLELAWEALGHLTVPVGAVLCGPDGAVIAEGRSRMYEKTAPAGQLSGSVLAHAEVNALIGLDPEPHYEAYTLHTSLEPCLLCLGAAGMATVGTVRFLGADVYGGAAQVYRPTRLLRAARFTVIGPDPGPVGILASALHIAFYLQRNPTGRTVGTHRTYAPFVVAAAERLLESGVPQLSTKGLPLPVVLEDLMTLVPADPRG